MLPSAAKGLVKLHERQTLVELGLHKVEFCGKVIRFAGHDLEVTRAAVRIKHLGQLIGSPLSGTILERQRLCLCHRILSVRRTV